MSTESIQRKIEELRELVDKSSRSGSSGTGRSSGRSSGEYSGYGNTYGQNYGRGFDVTGKSKCMSAGAIFCIVIVVLLAVAATIGGVMLTVRNRQQPEVVVLTGGAGGPSAVALNQRRNIAKQTQVQEQKNFETERRRREAAHLQKNLPSPVSLKAAPAASSAGPAGIPTPGSVSSPHAVNMRTTRTQHAGPGSGSRLMTDASSLPRAQAQAQAQAQSQLQPQAQAGSSEASPTSRRLKSAIPLLSSQSAALRPLGSNGISTRLAASAPANGNSSSSTGRSFEAIRKSLSAGSACGKTPIRTNQNTYNSGILCGLAEFRNEALVKKAAQIARELRAGMRCGPGGSSLPAASIAGFADYDPNVCQ